MTKQWIIFDLDGTLIESEQIWRDVRREFVVEQGGRWHDGAQSAMMGMRTDDWSRYMHDELSVKLAPDKIKRRVVERVIQKLSERIPVLGGADKVVESLAEEFVLGLATSATLVVARTVLAKTGWKRFFAAVVSADDLPHGKPAPDVYLRAIELLGAHPRHAAAVEDSTNGIRAAIAARLAVIAIPNRDFPPDSNALSRASRVLIGVQELNSTLVRDVLAQHRKEALR